MALTLTNADNVKETASCSGTSNPYTLLGAESQFQAISAVVADAGTTPYAAKGRTTGAWEIGIGTYASSGDTLARTTVKNSSTGSAINWTAEVIDIFIDFPAFLAAVVGVNYPFSAGDVIYTDANGNFIGSSTVSISGNTMTASNISASGNVGVQIFLFAGTAGTNEASGVYYIGATEENPILSASIIDGTTSNPASPNLWLHKHSANTPCTLVGSRSLSNATTHTPLTNGSRIFVIEALGSTQTGTNSYEYQPFGYIAFNASGTGTVSSTSSPGDFFIYLTPDGSTTPVIALEIDNSAGASFTGNVKISGTLTLANQSANTIFAGPASGSTAAPTFRSFVAADLPAPTNTTSASPDHAMAIGETAYVTFSSATSVPLNIACGNGQLYEVTIIGDRSVAVSNNNTVTLSPNNTTYSSAILENRFYMSNGGTTGTSDNTMSTFQISEARATLSEIKISTFTVNKTVSVKYSMEQTSTKYVAIATYIWNDTTTVWSSLGTVSLPYAQNGTIVIKRIL